jgi:hypothetical protein
MWYQSIIFIYNMEGYQILLNVVPTKSKSKYPFIIMNELQLKKTRRYIELEFVNALQAMRKKNKIAVSGGLDKDISIDANCNDCKCSVLFVDF